MDKRRIYTLTRVLTTVLVVLGHVTTMYAGTGVVTPARSSAGLAHLTTLIYSFHMPLFFLLSGCVYGWGIRQGKYTEPLPFLRKKARRLLIPYLVVGVLVVAPVMVALGFTGQSYLTYCFDGILLSHNSRHLWFLLALFWIFLLAIPARKPLLAGPWQTAIVLMVSLLLHGVSKRLPGTFQINRGASYQLWFLMGILLDTVLDRLLAAFARLGKWGAVAPILCALLLILQFRLKSPLLDYVYTVLGICAVLSAAAVISAQGGDLCARLADKLAKNSFGIYLFHPMLIYLLFFWLGGKDIHPWLLSALVFLASFAGAYGLTELCRRVRLGWVIGEASVKS